FVLFNAQTGFFAKANTRILPVRTLCSDKKAGISMVRIGFYMPYSPEILNTRGTAGVPVQAV
ncbi:MAG TPA: hypothetical protein VLN56_02040, partial [Gammaproteobacteria bacterium]|nr:hypothetical protein [Gammaproteobacteria bacterium]